MSTQDENIVNLALAGVPTVEEVCRKYGLAFAASQEKLIMSLPELMRAALAKGIPLLAGALNVPRRYIPIPGKAGDDAHEYLVEGLRAFGGAAGMGIQKMIDMTPEEFVGKAQEATQKVKSLMDQKVWVHGQYWSVDCPHADTWKGENPEGDMTRGRAIQLGIRPANCLCFGDVLSDVAIAVPVTAAAAPIAASSRRGPTIVDLYRQWAAEDGTNFAPEVFWKTYMQLDVQTQSLFKIACTQAGEKALDLIKFIAVHDKKEWPAILAGSVSQEHQGLAAAAVAKMRAESEECLRVLDRVQPALVGAKTWFAAKRAAEEERLAERVKEEAAQKEASKGGWFPLWAIAAVVVIVCVCMKLSIK